METLSPRCVDDPFVHCPAEDAICVWEDERFVHVRFHIPTVGPDELHMRVDGMCLQIRVDRQRPEDFRDVCFREPYFAHANWCISLPAAVAPEFHARCELGILQVRLTKR